MDERKVLGTGQGPLAGMEIEQGQHVRLNNEAPEWARPLTFSVEEVRAWGLVVVYDHAGGEAYHRAPWSTIKGIA